MSEYESVKGAMTWDVSRNLGALSRIDHSVESQVYSHVEMGVWRVLLEQVWQPIWRYTLTPED